jgi:hypothetical protein
MLILTLPYKKISSKMGTLKETKILFNLVAVADHIKPGKAKLRFRKLTDCYPFAGTSRQGIK